MGLRRCVNLIYGNSYNGIYLIIVLYKLHACLYLVLMEDEIVEMLVLAPHSLEVGGDVIYTLGGLVVKTKKGLVLVRDFLYGVDSKWKDITPDLTSFSEPSAT